MQQTADNQTAAARPSARRFRLALVLLVLNYVLGWLMLLGIEALALYWDSQVLALYVGPGVYAFSWGLLGAAVWIGGPEAVTYSRQWIRERRDRLMGSRQSQD